MNTFFRTFFICLFVALAFLLYKFVLNENYDTDLSVSKSSPIFGIHKDIEPVEKQNNDQENTDVQEPNETKVPDNKTLQKEQKTYIHICYFYGANGQLTPIERELSTPPTIQNSVLLLLKGPTIAETKKGIHTEIPYNVDLIYVKNEKNSVIVNLTSNFGNGGGSDSIENRIKQLSKTVKRLVPGKSVYLYINNKQVEYLGGEGVYIKQPLD